MTTNDHTVEAEYAAATFLSFLYGEPGTAQEVELLIRTLRAGLENLRPAIERATQLAVEADRRGLAMRAAMPEHDGDLHLEYGDGLMVVIDVLTGQRPLFNALSDLHELTDIDRALVEVDAGEEQEGAA